MKRHLVVLLFSLVSVMSAVNAMTCEQLVEGLKAQVTEEKTLRHSCSSSSKDVSITDNYYLARVIAKYGFEVVKNALDNEAADNLKLTNTDLSLPLIHVAAHHNSTDVLEVILEVGENIALGIQMPAEYYHSDGVSFLTNVGKCPIAGPLRYVRIPEHSHLGLTALHVAIVARASEAVVFLLEHGAGKTSLNHGYCPLKIAVESFPYFSESSEEKLKAFSIITKLLTAELVKKRDNFKVEAKKWLNALAEKQEVKVIESLSVLRPLFEQ